VENVIKADAFIVTRLEASSKSRRGVSVQEQPVK